MNNYVPLFGQIVDSSLWEEPLHVRVLYLTMLAVKDWDHIVRSPDHHLRRKANISDTELMDGLKVLSSPDKRTSIPQPFEGRRIERVDEGWLVLNGAKYQEMMRRQNIQAKWRRVKQSQRNRRKGHGPGARETEHTRGVESGELCGECGELISRCKCGESGCLVNS